MRKKFIIAVMVMSSMLFIPSLPVSSSPLTLDFETYYYSFIDPDMTSYNQADYAENQPDQTLNTDDNIAFAMTSLILNYNKKYLNSELFIKMRFEGFWGNDNIGENSENSAYYYDNLYTNFYFTTNSYIGIGRMDYKIGDSLNDYFFDDIIDGIVMMHKSTYLQYPYDVSIMADIMGMTSRPEGTSRFDFIQKDDEEIEDFQGDTISTRIGGNASFWFFRGFAYYIRYAASKQGGADIAQNGDTSANTVDGDYLTTGGGRLFYDFKFWGKADLTCAYSYGYDFQYDTDHKYSGTGIAANYAGDMAEIFDLQGSMIKNIFTSLSFGMFSEGYCGMRGVSYDEILLDDYYGYSVAPYADAYHFYDYAKDEDAKTYTDRSVAKTFYKIIVTTVLRMGLEMDLGFIMLTANENGDTGIPMGNEYIAAARYGLNNVVFSATFNLFQPGSYYTDNSQSNPYIPAGKDPFYGFMFSFISKFTLID